MEFVLLHRTIISQQKSGQKSGQYPDKKPGKEGEEMPGYRLPTKADNEIIPRTHQKGQVRVGNHLAAFYYTTKKKDRQDISRPKRGGLFFRNRALDSANGPKQLLVALRTSVERDKATLIVDNSARIALANRTDDVHIATARDNDDTTIITHAVFLLSNETGNPKRNNLPDKSFITGSEASP